MDIAVLNERWEDIPIGKENAINYDKLCTLWGVDERQARYYLADLSRYDNGDDYVLIRSSRKAGFYKTNNIADIKSFRSECMSRGRNVFAALRKIDRVLTVNEMQYGIENNLRLYRTSAGLTQSEVCAEMQLLYPAFDASLLSKMENGVCMPTPDQLETLAFIYKRIPHELLNLYTRGERA